MKYKLLKPLDNTLDFVEFTGKVKTIPAGTEFAQTVPSGFSTMVNGEVIAVPTWLLKEHLDYFEEIK